MAVSRIRKLNTQKEYEESIDEFVTLGYKIKDRGEKTCNVMKPNYGSVFSHVVIAILTAWWTCFIGNIIWLVYKYKTDSDRVLIKLID